MCTFSLPEAELLALLQVEEAVVVSFASTVDEGPAGLNLTVKVPAQSVSSTVPLLHGKKAHVSWSCRTHTHTLWVCTGRQKDACTLRKGQIRQRGAEAKAVIKSSGGPKTSIPDR